MPIILEILTFLAFIALAIYLFRLAVKSGKPVEISPAEKIAQEIKHLLEEEERIKNALIAAKEKAKKEAIALDEIKMR